MGMTQTKRFESKHKRKGTEISVLTDAIDAWDIWCKSHDVTFSNMTEGTYSWSREAFVDGYMRGVQKKITGE